MKLILTGTIEQISTRQDKTVVIKFGTQEITNDDAARLFQLRNAFVKVLLSDDNITNLESELVSAETIAQEKNNKTPSQRLRAVLFRVHEQSGETIPFKDWYETELERIIIHYKQKLN